MKNNPLFDVFGIPKSNEAQKLAVEHIRDIVQKLVSTKTWALSVSFNNTNPYAHKFLIIRNGLRREAARGFINHCLMVIDIQEELRDLARIAEDCKSKPDYKLRIEQLIEYCLYCFKNKPKKEEA